MDMKYNEYESSVCCCASDLEDAISALMVLDEAFESEGYQPEDQFNDWKAILFGKRFPMYLGAFRTIRCQIQRIADELNAATDELMDKCKAESAAV